MPAGKFVKQGIQCQSKFKSIPCLHLKYERGTKLPNVYIHHVNNIEHNIKRYVHTGMEVISPIPPWYCI